MSAVAVTADGAGAMTWTLAAPLSGGGACGECGFGIDSTLTRSSASTSGTSPGSV